MTGSCNECKCSPAMRRPTGTAGALGRGADIMRESDRLPEGVALQLRLEG